MSQQLQYLYLPQSCYRKLKTNKMLTDVLSKCVHVLIIDIESVYMYLYQCLGLPLFVYSINFCPLSYRNQTSHWVLGIVSYFQKS